MKKFKLYLFTLLSVMIVGIMNVNAEEVKDYDELVTCLATSELCTLSNDIVLENTIDISKDAEINLNGYSIQYTSLLFKVYGAEFSVTGTGTLEETQPSLAPIAVFGSATNDASFKSIVNVDENVTLKGWAGIMVRQHNKYNNTGNSNNAYGVEVNFAGKIVSVNDTAGDSGIGIYVNGNIEHTTNAPVINVAKTANIVSTGVGIFNGGYAVITVNGGKIVGDESGIEVRAGELIVNAGDISSTANKLEVESNKNGSTTIGAGIAIAQHTTGLPIAVEIHGGNISGAKAINVANPENNSEEKQELVTVAVFSGTFNTDVEKSFLSIGYTSKKIGETYTVGKENTITIGSVTAGKIEVDKNKAIVGETVTLTLTPNEGYELSKLEVKTVDGKTVEVKDNAFVMPNAAVTVTAEYSKITTTAEIPVISETTKVEEVVVGVKEADKVEDVLLDSLKENEELAKLAEDKSVKVVVEIESVKEADINKDVVTAMKEEAGKTTIAEFFDINILVKDVLNNSNLGNITELTEEIELMILLPEELKNSEEGTTRKYYVVRHHEVDGKEEVELLEAKVSEDGNYLVFKTDKFSTYALAYEDVAATPDTPQTGDSIGLYIILGFISVAAIGLSLNSLNKRRKLN